MHKFSVAILRVSTNKQDNEQQRFWIMQEIQRRGLSPVPYNLFHLEPGGLTLYPNQCVLIEDKSTGTRSGRKTYSWAIAQVKAKRVLSVIAYQVERMGRNTKDALAFADACIETKTELYSMMEKMDITSPEGRFMYTQLSAIAEYFSRNLGRKIHNTYVYLKEKAEKEGIPFVWGHRPKGMTNKDTAAQLPKVKQMLENGDSVRRIAKKTTLDPKTIRAWRKRFANGETWTVDKA